MSKFLHHEACPNCGSKDNLGVWEDGHKFCFGCKYYEQGTDNLHNIMKPFLTEMPKNGDYPWDAQEEMPSEPLKWLLSCGISFQQQKQFGIEWSPYRRMVVWKIHNPLGTIIGWQGRCFAPDAKTKYFTQGKIHEDICIIGL